MLDHEDKTRRHEGIHEFTKLQIAQALVDRFGNGEIDEAGDIRVPWPQGRRQRDTLVFSFDPASVNYDYHHGFSLRLEDVERREIKNERTGWTEWDFVLGVLEKRLGYTPQDSKEELWREKEATGRLLKALEWWDEVKRRRRAEMAERRDKRRIERRMERVLAVTTEKAMK